MKNKGLFLLVCTLLIIGVTTGCNTQPPQVSSSGAGEVQASEIPLNSRGRTIEQQNIDDRIQVTMNPAGVMWIHLIALDGHIVSRMSVRTKVTSSGKRLEPKHGFDHAGSVFLPEYKSWHTDEFLQPDGTYVESDAYVFWFDPQGRYHQWGTAGGLGYLLTDYPIDLVNPLDEITGMYQMDEQAHEWQLREETRLEKLEIDLGEIELRSKRAKPVSTSSESDDQ